MYEALIFSVSNYFLNGRVNSVLEELLPTKGKGHLWLWISNPQKRSNRSRRGKHRKNSIMLRQEGRSIKKLI